MNKRVVFGFLITFIALFFAWFAVVILSHGSLWSWFRDIWMPVVGLFWGFNIWIYPAMPWDFWKNKEARNAIFAGLAASLVVALVYQGIVYLLNSSI